MRALAALLLCLTFAGCGESPTGPALPDPDPGSTRDLAVPLGTTVEVDASRRVSTPLGSYLSDNGRIRLTVVHIARGEAVRDSVLSWDERNAIYVGDNGISVRSDSELAFIDIRVDVVAAPNEFDSIIVTRDQFNVIRKDGELYSPVYSEDYLYGVPGGLSPGPLVIRQGSAIVRIVHWLRLTDDAPLLQFNRWERNARWFRLF